jgi:hypothetical protein
MRIATEIVMERRETNDLLHTLQNNALHRNSKGSNIYRIYTVIKMPKPEKLYRKIKEPIFR